MVGKFNSTNSGSTSGGPRANPPPLQATCKPLHALAPTGLLNPQLGGEFGEFGEFGKETKKGLKLCFAFRFSVQFSFSLGRSALFPSPFPSPSPRLTGGIGCLGWKFALF